MEELIEALRTAAAQPEKHVKAQKEYFSKQEKDPIFNHCGTACCIAGDNIARDYLALFPETTVINFDLLTDYFKVISPWAYTQNKYGLSDVEAELCFSSYTNYTIHLTMADILASGKRVKFRGLLIIHDGDYLGDSFEGQIGDKLFENVDEFCTKLWEIAE